jgi:hypothetical protein
VKSSSLRTSLPDVILKPKQFDDSPGLAEISDETPRRAWDLPDQGWGGEDLIDLRLVRFREDIHDFHFYGIGQKCSTHILHGLNGPQGSLRTARHE